VWLEKAPNSPLRVPGMRMRQNDSGKAVVSLGKGAPVRGAWGDGSATLYRRVAPVDRISF
jgi:hypothetical protein